MDSRYLIKARWIVPVTAPPIPWGGIIINGGKIERLLTEKDTKTFPVAQIQEYPGHIILPGLINAHTHLELTNLAEKQWADRYSFTSWIGELVTTVRTWQEEDFLASIKRGIKELINNGITTVGDISTTSLSIPLLTEAGLSGVVYHEVLGFSTALLTERIEALKRRLDVYTPPTLLSLGISPHSPFTLSPQLLKQAYELARERGLSVTIHLAETQAEIDFLMGMGDDIIALLKSLQAWDSQWHPPGTTPVKYLAQVGALQNIVGIHLNLLTEDEIKLLKKHQVKGVYCPKSNAWFGRHNSHPLPYLLNNGIIMALGTDSLASNDTLSILEEMRQARALFPQITNHTLLEMATINGARVLGLAEQTGSITPGKAANLIAFETETDIYDPISYIVEKANKPTLVMINGTAL